MVQAKVSGPHPRLFRFPKNVHSPTAAAVLCYVSFTGNFQVTMEDFANALGAQLYSIHRNMKAVYRNDQRFEGCAPNSSPF